LNLTYFKHYPGSCFNNIQDSGWFTFCSQAGTSSYKELTLGSSTTTPDFAKVLIKSTDAPNMDFIFEGSGSQQVTFFPFFFCYL